MINRDENGIPVSFDKLSDVTDALKNIEKKLNLAIKKGDLMTEDEKAEVIEATKDLEPLIKLVKPENQSGVNPIELIGFLKQVMKIKSLTEKIQGTEND